MKKTLVFCDVCEDTFSGESVDFYFNGTPMDICGLQCFHKFWSAQYRNAIESQTSIRTTTGMEIIEGKRREA